MPAMLLTQAPLCVTNVLPANRHTQVPRFWLIGYDENRQPLTPAQVRGWGGERRHAPSRQGAGCKVGVAV